MSLAKFDHNFRNSAITRRTLPMIPNDLIFANSSTTIDQLTAKNAKAIAGGPYRPSPKVWWRWRRTEIDREKSHIEEAVSS
jgi:hypothetical protein